MQDQEPPFYADSGVAVHHSRIRVGSKTIQMRNIDSVHVVQPHRLALFLGAVILFCIAAYLMRFDMDSAKILGAFGLFVALIAAMRRNLLVIESGGKQQAILSDYRATRLIAIRIAIEQGMARRM